MSVSPGSSVYVSYPWKTADAPAMVDILQAVCEKNGIELRRDRDRISYGDSISKYMQELGAGGAIMVLVSEDYLKSPYCMYEQVRFRFL
jgi:internalin A